jgi:hypothetical protein
MKNFCFICYFVTETKPLTPYLWCMQKFLKCTMNNMISASAQYYYTHILIIRRNVWGYNHTAVIQCK